MVKSDPFATVQTRHGENLPPLLPHGMIISPLPRYGKIVWWTRQVHLSEWIFIQIVSLGFLSVNLAENYQRLPAPYSS